jgi:hypothetical protein
LGLASNLYLGDKINKGNSSSKTQLQKKKHVETNSPAADDIFDDSPLLPEQERKEFHG